MQRGIFVTIAIDNTATIYGSSRNGRCDHAVDLSLLPPSDPPIASLLPESCFEYPTI
jgi:hypothetical protein